MRASAAARREIADRLGRLALGNALLRQGTRDLERLHRVRGAHARTARRIRRALAVVALAAGLLGVPLANVGRAVPPAPCFDSAQRPLANAGFFPEPALADIDGDGDLDAFVGTEYGDTVFFANTGTAAAPSFSAPQANPFGLGDVGANAAAAFADIDGDGDLDAFVGNEYGETFFFPNTGTVAAPAFAAPQTDPFGLTEVGSSASPELADIDGDGDLDAFIGAFVGTTVLFANTGTSAAPAFAAPQVSPFGLTDVGTFASPDLADIDGDGDLDAFVGADDGVTLFFENTGTPATPAFAAPQPSPFGLADVGYYASPALADIDGDGDLDAFVGELVGNIRFFANTGTATAPAFVEPSPFGLGDVTHLASPALADIDGDGDLDAFVGDGYGNTIFFANTGTAAAPAFAAGQTNPFGLADVGSEASPALADIDDDGDLDAFVGRGFGDTVFFANTGTAAAPAFAAPQTNPFALADVGSNASPALADIDGDGDLDAFVGTFSGETIFFANTGTAAAPAFASPQTSPFGLTDVGYAASPELADIDGDGDLDAFVGENYGTTIFFENLGTAALPSFNAAQTSPFGLGDIGSYSSPALADIDGDGDLDAFVGEDDGETILFENDCACGDGAIALSEQCDDGNVASGDCCSSTCQFEPAASSCADANVCNGDETCDGGGECEPGLPLDCADADLCTQDSCDPLLGCENPAEPATTCADAWEKGSLLIQETVPGKERVLVKASKGPALVQVDFGDPLDPGGTSLAACVYDDAGTLVASMDVDRAGDTCGTKDCWKPIGSPPPNGKGFLFRDSQAASDGITRIKLKGGAAGKSSFQIKGANDAAKGQLALPVGLATGLASSASATVQLFGSDSPECLSLTVDDIQKQTNDFFKAKK